MVSDNMFHDVSRDDLKSKKVTKTVAALAIVAASSAMFSACGEPSAVPMNDEFAGNSGQSADDGGNPSGKYDAGAQQSKSSAQSEDSQNQQNQPKTDTGNYKDGDYKVKATYGPVAEDSFDVRLSVANGDVSDVQMTASSVYADFKRPYGCILKGYPWKNRWKAVERFAYFGCCWSKLTMMPSTKLLTLLARGFNSIRKIIYNHLNL